jgi:polyhydroxybutyrate depolymerase
MSLDSWFPALCGLIVACAACGSEGAKVDPAAMPPAGSEATPPAATAGNSAIGAAGMSMVTAPSAGSSGAKAGSGAAGGAGMSMAAGTAASAAGSGGMSGAPPATSGAGGAPMTPGGTAGMPAVVSSDPMPSAGCMSGSLMPGRTMGSIQSSGGNRSYIQYVPMAYDGKKPLPLLVDLHPYSVGASYAESSSGFRQLAESEGYIYLAPQGIGNEWDSVGDKDEKFIRDLVNSVAMKGCVDLRRVYATGCSNGGAFSFLLMCTAEDIFAAVAPMCGTAFFDIDTMCMLDRPVSIMVRIGRQDTLNCWEGEGMVLDAPNVPSGTRVPCAKTVQKLLSDKYHCKGAIKMEGRCEFVGDCDQGTEIAICGENTGHVVYSTAVARDTWMFLKRFYKP